MPDKQRTQRTATNKRKRSRFSIFGEVIAELKKVVWPSRRDVVRLSIMVIVVSAAVGLMLGIADYGFTELVNRVFLGR